MASGSDEVFFFDGDEIRSLPSRSFRDGLFGKNLEDSLQTLIEKQPNLITLTLLSHSLTSTTTTPLPGLFGPLPYSDLSAKIGAPRE